MEVIVGLTILLLVAVICGALIIWALGVIKELKWMEEESKKRIEEFDKLVLGDEK